MFLLLMNKIIIFLLLLFCNNSLPAQEKQYKAYTIAFYNVENLFDTINDPGKGDDDFLPRGANAWTGEKYRQKLVNIAKVLTGIGSGQNTETPAVIGLCEIENRRVLEDLIRQPELLGKEYGIIHFDSPDSRGTDVALLYSKKHFRPSSYKNIPLIIRDTLAKQEKPKGKKKAAPTGLFTRDQLLVTGHLDGEEVHFIVNHWPSRYGGEKKSRPNRLAAAALNKLIVDSLYRKNPQAKIITMGDFNDGPEDESIAVSLGAKGYKNKVAPGGLFNPMFEIGRKGTGSVAYKDGWDVFDQVIVSEPLLGKDYSSLRYWKAGIYNPDYLVSQSGKYKGYPLRNANGEAGYSDHFPVYIYLVKEVE